MMEPLVRPQEFDNHLFFSNYIPSLLAASWMLSSLEA